MRTVVIEQPNYLPWIGYFDLIAQSGLWVWYDDVQYTKRDWRNRNRVALGERSFWLTIPVQTKGRSTQRICDVEIDDSRPWRKAHLESIRHCYRRAPFRQEVVRVMTEALGRGDALLADLTIALNEAVCALLGLSPQFLRSSRMNVAGERQERLLEICRRSGATSYLSGPAARAYLDPRVWGAAGIELRYIVYDYHPYERGGQPFIPALSILDPLAWLGPAGTAAFLAAHHRSELEPAQC